MPQIEPTGRSGVQTTSQVSCLHARGLDVHTPTPVNHWLWASPRREVWAVYTTRHLWFSALAGKAAPLARGQSSEDSSRWKPWEAKHRNWVRCTEWVEGILWNLDGRTAGSSRIRKHCSPAPARLVYSLKFSGSYFVCLSERGPVLILGVPWYLVHYFAHKMKAFFPQVMLNLDHLLEIPWWSKKWPKFKEYTYSMSIC